MRTVRGVVAALTLVALMVPLLAAPSSASPVSVQVMVPSLPRGAAVTAVIDTGVNPYSIAFRDKSPMAYRHPSKYIPGFPKDAEALHLSLDLPYEEAVKADADIWKTLRRGELYWIPGTKIIGAISFGAGGTNCPLVPVPPANAVQSGCDETTILDDHGHGTMTASRSTGVPNSLGAGSRLVAIEGLGARSVEWAAEQGWIDVQSNSWVNLVPPPAPSGVTNAFAAASKRMLTLVASGNGTAYLAGVAPTPTYLLSTAPPGVVLVGGHDNGKMTLWAGAPPHVVADAYAGMTAIGKSNEKMRPDPIACCTSAASPYAAGGAAAIVTEARRILRDKTAGTKDGLVACGRKGATKDGPLADGVFTVDELKDVFLHTADAHPAEGKDDGDVHWAGGPRPPDHPEYGPGANPFCLGCTTTPVPWEPIPDQVDTYQLIGYGGINEYSVELAKKVLAGTEPMPERPTADAQYELDQALRDQVMSTRDDGGEVKLPACGPLVMELH
jgi:hypothetical protein